jgi:Ca2+-binding EF-hand superfamily protein
MSQINLKTATESEFGNVSIYESRTVLPRLKQENTMNKFVKTVILSAIAIGVAASGATAQGKHDGSGGLYKRFDQIDANADGFITVDEMAEHRVAHFKEIDSNGDDAMSKEEMQTGMAAHMAEMGKSPDPAKMEKHLNHKFSKMDKNGDGKIDTTEMQMRSTHMFPKVDKDGDGKISKDEAKSIRRHMKNAG